MNVINAKSESQKNAILRWKNTIHFDPIQSKTMMSSCILCEMGHEPIERIYLDTETLITQERFDKWKTQIEFQETVRKAKEELKQETIQQIRELINEKYERKENERN